MSLKFVFLNTAENKFVWWASPSGDSPHKDFRFGVKWICHGHNKIDMSVIQCLNLQSVDNIRDVDGREKVDRR